MTTIYLSRLMLDPTNRRVRHELNNVYELHRTVMSGFPPTLPKDERVLFRLDEDHDGRPTLLVQSQTEPDWSGLAASYLRPSDPFDPIPNPAVKRVELDFRAGQMLRFRLRANPTVKQKQDGQKQGHRVAIAREEKQLEWLSRKAEAGGFRIRPTDVRVAELGREFGLTKEDPRADKRHHVELHVVQFDGFLQVADPACFAKTLRAGIGSAKGFGCGLLSLAAL